MYLLLLGEVKFCKISFVINSYDWVTKYKVPAAPTEQYLLSPSEIPPIFETCLKSRFFTFSKIILPPDPPYPFRFPTPPLVEI